MEKETYQNSSGSKINLYSLLPMGEVRAVIHMTHGMAEHVLRYSRFAKKVS
jgi:alpha-beta hydrolase superfamily lysophospholipase